MWRWREALAQAGRSGAVRELRAGHRAPDAVLPHQCHLLGQQLGYATRGDLGRRPLGWWTSSTPTPPNRL